MSFGAGFRGWIIDGGQIAPQGPSAACHLGVLLRNVFPSTFVDDTSVSDLRSAMSRLLCQGSDFNKRLAAN